MTKEVEISYENFDWVQLDKYLQFKITTIMAAELMGCCPATIKNFIRRKYDMTFSEYSDVKMSKTKLKLVQKALDMAFSGNTVMMIFCLKNICKWKDNFDDNEDIAATATKIFKIVPYKKPPIDVTPKDNE